MAHAKDPRVSTRADKMASFINRTYDPSQITSAQLTYLNQECHKLLGLVQHERRIQVTFQAKIAEQREQLAQKCVEVATAKARIVELEKSLEIETLKRKLIEERQNTRRGKKREREEGEIVESKPFEKQRVKPPRKRLTVMRRSLKYSFSEFDSMTREVLFVMDAPSYRITSKTSNRTTISISNGDIIERLKRELIPSPEDNIEAFFLLRLRGNIISVKFIKIYHKMKFLVFNNISIKNNYDCSGEILILQNGRPTYKSDPITLKFR